MISRVCGRFRSFVRLDLGLRAWKDVKMRGLIGLEFMADVFAMWLFLTIE
jgi:hypothetical protein